MKRVIKINRILVICMLLFSIGMASSPGSAKAQESTARSALASTDSKDALLQIDSVIVRMFQADYVQVAQLIKPLRLIDYDSFVWLELDATDLATIQNSGVNFFLEQEPNLLLLNRFQFDPLLGEPEIPPEQQTSYAPGEEGFFLVQFFGPT
ncbi:MAG TPA: hypothetical protein VK206_01820, partial [Anaerolineales bacterium]|nr:hypothetical protein [Anaerolineales bacterium]